VEVVQPEENGLQYARRIISPFLVPLGMAAITLVFTIFILISREDLRNRLLRLAGLSQLNVMTEALDDATKRIGRYLLMQFLVNAGFGVLFGVGLYFIGLPYAALWGAIAAILRIIPYVGSMVAAALPLTLSLAVSDTWLPVILTAVLFGSLEFLIANFIEPWLYGAHTGISSLAILVSAIFWTVLWGPAGLILSTPLTVCVVVLGRYVPELSFLYVLLGDEPVLEPEAHLYQRLLATDQVEARAVIDLCLKDRSLAELYDSVLVPALTLAEQDRHKGALDPDRLEFLFLSFNEMLTELSAHNPEGETSAPEAEEPASAPEDVLSSTRVFCFAAADDADEITATMLSQLLDRRGFSAFSVPVGASGGLVEPGEHDLICISALPPFAFAHARVLCGRLRARFPRANILVGIWGYNGSLEDALQRFERARPDKIVTSLRQAVEQAALYSKARTRNAAMSASDLSDEAASDAVLSNTRTTERDDGVSELSEDAAVSCALPGASRATEPA